jgi:peptide/nickel transport system ATP-binding protein
MPSSERPSLLRIRDLVVEFATREGPLVAVDGLSLDLDAGRRIGIVGESGSGKSTLALALLGLLPENGRVREGEILFGGRDLVRASEKELQAVRGGDIAIVFQEALGSLNPVLTVGRQLTEAIQRHQTVSGAEARERAVVLLREVRVPSPETRLRQYPHELSGGMRQRVVIAIALACDPKVVIADEPTTALDVTTEAGVIDLLVRLSAERGMAMVLITHDLGLVAGFADSVLVMYAGAPMEYAPVEEIFANPRHPYTRGLMAAVPRITDRRAERLASIPGTLPRLTDELPGCRFQPRCYMTHGRELCRAARPGFAFGDHETQTACHFADEDEEPPKLSPAADEAGRAAALPRDRVAADGDSLLVVENLSKDYIVRRGGGGGRRKLRAVDHVSFSLRRGESLGLVGESGSGKSTIARLLLGLTEPDSGTVLFERTPLEASGKKRRNLLRGRLQMVFQDPADSLDPVMNVASIVAEPLTLIERKRSKTVAPRIAEALHLVGLTEGQSKRRPRELSGGQRQRVAIARALVTNPAVIACDEAVSSLDVSVRAQILNLLMDLQTRLGLSYLFISHDLSVVRHICDTIVVMYAGRFVEIADADTVFTSPQHPYTIALLSAVPVADPVAARERARIRLEGDAPDLTEPLVGCPFRSRCWKAQPVCATDTPPLLEHAPGQWSACHFPERGGSEG